MRAAPDAFQSGSVDGSPRSATDKPRPVYAAARRWTLLLLPDTHSQGALWLMMLFAGAMLRAGELLLCWLIYGLVQWACVGLFQSVKPWRFMASPPAWPDLFWAILATLTVGGYVFALVMRVASLL